tara:strand:+ start:275 stop:853 length:579 start_codon:yes stop_codon:yes gene_type:complete
MAHMAKTTKIGDKGEAFIRNILKWRGYTILKSTSNNSDWDCLAEKDTKQETYETKCQPNFAKYGMGGFSVEVGNTWQGAYINRPVDFIWDNKKCVCTGLSVTKADYQVFTDGKYIAFFIPTTSLIEWFKRVKSHETHRISFGGNGRALQTQLRLDELMNLQEYHVSNFNPKGKKSKSELAFLKALSYINDVE